ncbi:MAG: response regulator transcription factor [Oscillospiraceae bacterium]|nr:response regulator transcription factor [Oscillospiraceae bacterium]
MRVLVVDDEKLLVKGIKFNLEMDGFEVVAAYDGEKAVELVRGGGIDLVIMDLMMPKKNGLEACLEIRSFSKIPIIMLTAKSEDNDKIIGFEYGADDYVTKPFNILELKARVRALLRRSSSSEPASAPSSVLVSGPLRLETESRVAYRNGEEVELTAREFDLVELLMRNPGKVYGRDSLLKLVWGPDYQGDIRTVDVHIRRIREKLEENPAEPAKIMTKWGVGYYLKT